MKELSLALVQDPAPGSVDEFRERMHDLVRQYPRTSSFVFPELHLLGGLDPSDQADLRRHAEPLDGPLCKGLAALAAELGVWLMPGSVLESTDGGLIYNTMVVFSPAGELAASYRKIFPWRPTESVTPGADFSTLRIGDVGTVGLMVCYDAWFPEVSRQLAWMGAELLVNVVLTPTGDRAQEVILVQANAIANQVFVASVNAAAPTGQGRSLLVDPQGRILAQAVGAESTVLAATIDLDEVRRTREFGTAGVTRPWSQFADTDEPIELPVYGGRITPRTWRPTP
ncbi:carbon-nitrogen hydrolase family protein [Mycobacterium sp. NPDC006124]|uniref:carbon-nitrogen hydrolase family protein n=1 Tax=Mycobacterium sp. NPDC006124 TaxID=3156729 RepID=UPI0033A0538C